MLSLGDQDGRILPFRSAIVEQQKAAPNVIGAAFFSFICFCLLRYDDNVVCLGTFLPLAKREFDFLPFI